MSSATSSSVIETNHKVETILNKFNSNCGNNDSHLNNNNNSGSNYNNSNNNVPNTKSHKIGEKLDFFNKEMGKEYTRTNSEHTVTLRSLKREKSPKVDITKRRSMFELRGPSAEEVSSMDISTSSQYYSAQNLSPNKKSVEVTTSLKNRVASFECLDTDSNKYKGITPPRDSKFKEKLANFSQKSVSPERTNNVRKKTPERDETFHQKLSTFTQMEKKESAKVFENKTTPIRDFSLKNKIASFEQLDQIDNQSYSNISTSNDVDHRKEKDMSAHFENLSVNSPREEVIIFIFYKLF